MAPVHSRFFRPAEAGRLFFKDKLGDTARNSRAQISIPEKNKPFCDGTHKGIGFAAE